MFPNLAKKKLHDRETISGVVLFSPGIPRRPAWRSGPPLRPNGRQCERTCTRARQIIRNFIGVRISRGCSTLILILFEKLQANSVLSYRFKANFSLMIDFRDLSTVFCSREQTFENFVNFCLEHCQIFSHC